LGTRYDCAARVWGERGGGTRASDLRATAEKKAEKRKNFFGSDDGARETTRER